MSDPISTAQEAIASTEQRLRTLIQTALEKQRYSDVAKLAPLADAVLNILKTVRNGEVALRSADTAGGGKNDDTFLPQTRIASATGRGSDAVYPRFERHGDKLVKIAWSKKDRREYEHRASSEVIFRVAELFQRDRTSAIPFKMDSLMPFKTRSGAEIPSYQAYLALAWFRSLGVIEPRGENGYAIVVDNLRSTIGNAWNRLPDALNH